MNGTHNQQPLRPDPNLPDVPRPARPRYHFRIEWLLVPLVCLGAWWVFRSIKPVFTWSNVMNRLGVLNTARYTKLATLGLVLICIVIMHKILRSDDSD